MRVANATTDGVILTAPKFHIMADCGVIERANAKPNEAPPPFWRLLSPLFLRSKIIFDWCQALARVLADRRKLHVADVQPTCEVSDKPAMNIQAIFAIYLV